jgi:hypothetical protein
MKTMNRFTSRLAVLGVLTLLGSQAQAGLGWVPACTEAGVDLDAEELQVDGPFRWCPRPSVLLSQADGSYQNLGTPIDWTDDFVLVDLNGATVIEGATQQVVVKCGWAPRCKIDAALAGPDYPAPVAQSGQTPTVPLDPAPAGSDGALQKGVAWPDPRFTDNGDGTVTDELTGLIWLQEANCFGLWNWNGALGAANALNSGECGLMDGSAEGDWRLPNRKELLSLIDLGQFNPALPSGHPFSGVKTKYYWSSSTSTLAFSTSFAWVVDLYDGFVGLDDKDDDNDYVDLGDGSYVWPVRGGQ